MQINVFIIIARLAHKSLFSTCVEVVVEAKAELNSVVLVLLLKPENNFIKLQGG